LEDLFELIQLCGELAGAFGFFLVIVTRFTDVGEQIEEREVTAAPLDELPFSVDERDVGGGERCFRADESRNRSTGGTGLGLSICKAIADAHGATLEVESTIGGGSKFTLKVPSSSAT